MGENAMKKEKQIGVRVGLPAFFAMELEDVYKRTEGAHRALAFPDFIGLLVGMGLEQYRKGNALLKAAQDGAPEDEGMESQRADPIHLFDIDLKSLPSLFKEYDEAMETDPPENGPRLRMVRPGGTA
jgi:hypothetical protein